MTLGDSRRAGLSRLQQLKTTTAAAGDDMARERLRFDALKGSEPTRAVSAFNLFQTPEPIADRLARLLSPRDGERILEPSAGLGRLYRAVRCLSACEMVLVESAPQCAAELYATTRGDDACRLVQSDFLACDAERLGGLFDAVVMNPPFKMGRDIKHIRHAASLLNPGGRLVSLCYAGTKQASAFKNRPGWTWEDLPPRSFTSEGTRAAVALITFTNSTPTE